MMAYGSMAQEVPQPALPRIAFRAGAAARAVARSDETAGRWSLAASSRSTAQRLAALLTSISRNNSYEGRDPQLIPDSLASGFVADLLGVEVSDLAESLVELEHQGFVTQAQSGGLRLVNLRALESLADAH
jgi:CRP-like cAMP-binding protein